MPQLRQRRRFLSQTIFSPKSALLLLVAACSLFLVYAEILLIAISPPYDSLEVGMLWSTAIAGIALVVFGAGVGWDALRQLQESEDLLHATEVRSQDEIRQARERLQGFIVASPLAIIATDMDARVELWNPAAERLLGWSEAEVIGRRYMVVPPEEHAHFIDRHARVLAGETVREEEARRVRKDGTEVVVSVSAAPVRDAQGAVRGTLAVLADITERKRAEEERGRLETQLRHAQKMEAVGRLAGGVAHDFNNVLTAIKGNAELVLELDLPENARADVGEIAVQAERAASLTRQLLAFSRQQIVEPRVISVNDVVAGIEKMLRRLIGEDLVLATSLSAECYPVLADPGQLEQVLVNLIVNARDALPRGGTIVIATRNARITEEQARRYPYNVVPGEYLLLSVSDDGHGMGEEIVAHMFEPFFTTKPAGKGTGLGLSTVYGIVKQSRGYIWVDSAVERGTTVRIYLPRTVSHAALPARREERAARTFGAQGRILVVEDEEAVRSLVRRVLERRGYEVIQAAGPREAIGRIEELRGEIDLLFTDVVMPEMSGRELVDITLQRFPQIAVLYTSGYAESVLARNGTLEDGINFLAKPFSPDALIDKVAEVLNPTPARG